MSNTQTKNVPELRFPGFEGEWEEKKLGNLTTKIGSGKTPKGGSENYTNKGIPFLRSQNIRNGKLNLNDLVYISKDIDDEMKNSRTYYGDVLLNITGASIGRTAINSIVEIHANLNQHVCIIRLKKEYYYNFFGQYLLSRKGKRKIFLAQSGGSREGLNFKEIANLKIFTPTIFEEQQKIGKFFSKLDRQIELEEQKLELLQQQKKGYMQKIFTQELRFKDEEGKDYPDWKSKSIQEIFENKGGTALETEFNFDGNYKVISIGSYSINSTYNDQNIRVNKNKKTEKYILSKGDLAMVLNDKTKDGKIIGRSIFIDKDNQYIYNQRTERLIPFAENDNKFLWFLMNTDLIRNKIKGMMQGATQVYINYSSIKLISIQLPLLEEQQKIRGFLEVLSGITTK
ncbi:restriction endonuclease subunit S, partial [Staphylococcus aureus]|uniref:restriction endonuclease subunit S n=1 Tax=Staphylococcus aureus TaxID=1280 RepID=UPI0018EC43DF